MSPKETAVYWIEYIHRHGEDALRSPIMDMPWWQSSLVDIYAFVALMTSLGIFIVSVIVKKFMIFVRKILHPSSKIKIN